MCFYATSQKTVLGSFVLDTQQENMLKIQNFVRRDQRDARGWACSTLYGYDICVYLLCFVVRGLRGIFHRGHQNSRQRLLGYRIMLLNGILALTMLELYSYANSGEKYLEIMPAQRTRA